MKTSESVFRNYEKKVNLRKMFKLGAKESLEDYTFTLEDGILKIELLTNENIEV